MQTLKIKRQMQLKNAQKPIFVAMGKQGRSRIQIFLNPGKE